MALAEQGRVRALANATSTPGLTLAGEVGTQLQKITEQATWLKKVTPSVGSFSD